MSLFFSCVVHAEPWYSGPLLSDPATVTPIGHGYIQMHAYKTYNYGAYNLDYDFFGLPQATTGEFDLTYNYGITNNTEFQFFLTYLDNKTEGRQANNLGDTTLMVATQVLLQNGRKWPPNIKLFFRQLFPTGHYDNLNENLYGTDATGQGSYLSTLAINLEHVIPLQGGDYVVSFATASFTHAPRISLDGFSIYGGNSRTHGTMWPGNSMSFNLALEYFPSQRWGYILEAYIYAQKASKFKGEFDEVLSRLDVHRFRRRLGRIIFNRLRPSYLNLGAIEDPIGHGNIALFSFAPAIEYSFSKDMSAELGCWFSAAGKNTPAFYTPMLKFTSNW